MEHTWRPGGMSRAKRVHSCGHSWRHSARGIPSSRVSHLNPAVMSAPEPPTSAYGTAGSAAASATARSVNAVFGTNARAIAAMSAVTPHTIQTVK